jgi:hypothetical protein
MSYTPKIERLDLPTPETLVAYEEALSGSGKLVLSLLEEESQARFQVLKVEKIFYHVERLLGQGFAFLSIALLAFSGASVLENGNTLTGLALTSSALITIVVSFLKYR